MIRRLLLSAAALALLPSAANAAWYQASSKHFVVYSNDTPAKIKAYTEKLERFDKAIRLLHVAPEDKRGPAARVTIYVVDDISAIQKLYGGRNAAGFYQARASGSVAFTPRSSGTGNDYGMTPQVILFHEYTHHWMLTNWSDAAMPPWLVEGFAEFHATAIAPSDGSITFGANPNYRQFTVGEVNLLPAEELLRPNPGKLSGRSSDALYSRGWLLVHYLTFDPGRRKLLANYIGAINSGKPIDEATRMLGNPAALDGKMNAWGKQAKLPSIRFTAAELPIGEVTVRALTPGEAALMPATMVSNRGVNPKTAPGVVALARRLAAAFPTDPAAQNELAEAEYDAASLGPEADAVAGYLRAEAAADRVLAADPKSIHGLLYKGMAQEAVAVANKETNPAKWQAIRRWFLAANKLDTENPEPLVQFYDSFTAAKEKPSKNAETALLYAYALAPYDGALRIRAAIVYLQQGKAKEARIALAPVAYNFDERGAANAAQKVLDLIETGDTAGALKLLMTPPEKKPDDKKGGDKDKNGA